MDLITWEFSSPQSQQELDYDKRARSAPWAEQTSAESTSPPLIPSLIVSVSLFGLLVNGIVLWLLDFRIKRGPLAVYFFNMTIADFLFLFCHSVNIMGKWLFSLDWDIVFLMLSEFCASVSENILVTMSMERCLAYLYPIWYQRNRPKRTSAIVCSLIWLLTVLVSGIQYIICGLFSSSSGCQEIIRHSYVWPFLLSLLHMVSLILLSCVQCRRGHCPRSSSFWILVVLLSFQLLFHSLPFFISQFNSEPEDEIPKAESVSSLYYSESDSVIFEIEDDVDILASCMENSFHPVTYFCMSCCKKRREGEPLRVFLQRILMDEEELEDGTEIVYGSPGDVALTLTEDRTSEELRGDVSAPCPALPIELVCPEKSGFPSSELPTPLFWSLECPGPGDSRDSLGSEAKDSLGGDLRGHV
ncbi:proto-oncogene Mas-like [Antechinus flavipes]|uniref:proto-oncogene Mas-like n=1 Tax=Antechinus flavipes TaxID=38775 RepID=UPI002235A584|nr:proto-oncogene Mas-like [Antechinus flavipes]